MPTGTMLRVFVTLALAVPLSACEGTRGDAETAVRESLKDPDSARFGEYYFNEKTQKGCLVVNAKNSMGGYTGNQTAYLTRKDEKWSMYLFEIGGLDYCKEKHADAAD